MKGILSNRVLAEFDENGFVRTGIHVPPSLLSRVHGTYQDMPGSASNWSYFEVQALGKSIWAQGWRKFPRRLARNLAPWMLHLHSRRALYHKSIFGSSDALPKVLQECLDQGLAGYLGEIPLLVGHDIYLEQNKDQASFGFHEDGFAWTKFFQTDDDLSLYIPLQDLTEGTGGRLLVHRKQKESTVHKRRNEDIQSFSAYCREFVDPDHTGMITREAVEKSPHRRMIGREHVRVMNRRLEPPYPEPGDMNPVDAQKGEVILFNNKRFHDVEPWKFDTPRAIYAIRLFPMYDIGLAPPVTFLNDAPCNRFVLDAGQGTLSRFDLERDRSRFVRIPH